MVWIVPGAAGLALSWGDGMAALLSLVLGTAVALAARTLGIFPGGDCLCLVALSAVLPSVRGVPVVLFVAPIAVLGCLACRIGMSVRRNLGGMVRGTLFLGISDNPCRKALGFFLLHRRRPGDRFGLPAQRGDRLRFRIPAASPDLPQDFEGFVCPAVPAIPAMLAATALLMIL